MNIFLSIVFALFVVAITLAVFIYKKLWWVPLIVGVLIIIGVAWLLHSWMLIWWAVLLAGFSALSFLIKKKLWQNIFCLFVVVIIALGIYFLSPLFPNFHRSPVITPPLTQPAPLVIAELPAQPAILNTPCLEAVSKPAQVHGGKVELDLNDGDPFDFGLTIISPNVPQGDQTLVVLTEPGYIFDVVHPVMYFTSFRLQGTLGQAVCSATKLASNAQTFVFVGKATTPKGWTTTDKATGWWSEMVTKQYSENALTPGGDWTAIQIAVDDKNRDLKSDNLIYGQLWNPDTNGNVVHFQIEKGYVLSIPKGWQGTYWTVTGADPKIVQDRFVQASKEVVERDKLTLGNVTLLYCGTTIPTTKLQIGSDSLSWTTGLDGWQCTKIN